MFNRPPKGVSLRLARGQESRGHYSRAQWRLKGAPRCSTLPRRDEQSRLIFPFSYEGVDDVPDEQRILILRVIHTARNWPKEDWPRSS
jgi:plasmid stabilization system protein ParE